MGYSGLIDNTRESSLHDGWGGKIGECMGMIYIARDSINFWLLHDGSVGQVGLDGCTLKQDYSNPTLVRHLDETFWWDILMRNFYETFLRDIFMRHFDETFWWDIFMRHYNETFWWYILMRHFNETLWWDILMRHFNGIFLWDIWMRHFDEK